MVFSLGWTTSRTFDGWIEVLEGLGTGGGQTGLGGFPGLQKVRMAEEAISKQTSKDW